VPSNRQKIYNVVSVYFNAREFSRQELLDLMDRYYRGTNHGSILPSDYLCRDALKNDPSNDGNRNYNIYPRFLERLGRDRYRFVGWDGIEESSIEAPVLRTSTGALQAHAARSMLAPSAVGKVASVSRESAPTEREERTDQVRLVTALRELAPSVRKSSDRAWRREAAVRVIDCVLSLNRRYDSFVVPRLDGFERVRPGVRTVRDLHVLIATYPSPHRFVAEVLDYQDQARAATLGAVVDWLVKISGHGNSATQLSNLERWAANARPAQYASLGIRGFALAGFQYLRMLFGANTTKPDIHIRRYVASCVGHAVSDIEALQLLERAAPEAGIVLRDLDTTIWEISARIGQKVQTSCP
jgi:hypothetical protein